MLLSVSLQLTAVIGEPAIRVVVHPDIIATVFHRGRQSDYHIGVWRGTRSTPRITNLA